METQLKTVTDLRNQIVELERKENIQKNEVQNCFANLMEDLKPGNLIKNMSRSIFSGSNKENLTNSLIGLGTGMFGRKLIIGNSHNFFGKSIGKIIQWGTAGVVAKNADKIKVKAVELISKLFGKKHIVELPMSSKLD